MKHFEVRMSENRPSSIDYNLIFCGKANEYIDDGQAHIVKCPANLPESRFIIVLVIF